MIRTFDRPLLALVGCSFSAEFMPGISVGRALARRLPGHTVINLAHQGTSRMYSAWVCDWLQQHVKPDVMVFQLTGGLRFTRWEEHDPLHSLTTDDGRYYHVDHRISHAVKNINSGVVYDAASDISDERRRFGQQLFDWFTIDMLDFEGDVTARAYRDRVSFIYSHRRDPLGAVPNVLATMGEDIYRSHVIDEGEHFDATGISWTADWIIDNLVGRSCLTPDQVIKPT